MAFIITKGEDVSIPIKLQYKSGSLFDLTGKTVTAKLKIGTLTTLVSPANITIVDARLGEMLILLDDTQSNSLLVGNLDIDIYVDLAGDTKIFKIRKSITVEERLV